MSDLSDTPFTPGPYKLARKCGVCGGSDFDVFEVGPHLTGSCLNCEAGLSPGNWIARSELGLAPQRRRRDGFAPEVRMEVLQAWNHRCAWCGISAAESRLEVGHIIQRAKIIELGGEDFADDLVNLAPSCPDCNCGAHMTSRPALNLLFAAMRIAKYS